MIPHSKPTLGPEEKQAVAAVLDSGQIAQGRKVEEFEKKLCEFTGRRHGVAVSSGTAALCLSLHALGIGTGDEVILPSFTCAALLHAVEAVRARPLLTDMDPEDFNISVDGARKRIRRKTKAILVPHAFGRSSRMQELLALGVPVIEDGTQALGAEVGGKPVGSLGQLSVFSFYATKMITTGEGGVILTDSGRLAERLRDLRDYDKKRDHRLRTNSKMTDLAAAMGIVQLQKLPSFIRARRQLAQNYRESLRDLGLTLPREDEDRDHVYFRYVIRMRHGSSRGLQKLNEGGIEAKKPIFKPLHQYLQLPDREFRATAQAMRETCSLPIFPSLEDSSLTQVCEAVRTLTAPSGTRQPVSTT
ncbi:MAG: DegT/DnrJ/EryC1/StrS family aminotransferase [Candidatus Omnitrophica bacterium]|nr:DegT/DnrJ/EryC1/StrS family aminotransferase [Candidatus Omnitrophota bacterium]